MSTRRLVKGLATLSVAGVAVLGVQAPALAQTGRPAQPGPPNCDQANPAGRYPPGQCRRAANDSTPQRGQAIIVTSGSGFCPAGGNVTVAAFGRTQTVVSDDSGNATASVTVPGSAAFGDASVDFTCVLNTALVRVPITVTPASAAAPGRNGAVGPRSTTRSSVLPRTGADHITELTAAGLGLVVVGGAVVVASRRRRDEATPAGLA